MRRLARVWGVGGLLGGLALTGCGGGNGGGAAGGAGTVTEPWTKYCTATFTADTPIVEFDETKFTARAGEEYLMTSFDDSFGHRAELLYLTPTGPDSFDLEPGADSTWPFMSNCEPGKGVAYYAAFTDVSVFSDQALSSKICDLKAGAAHPAGTSSRGFSLAGSAAGGASIYEVMLGPFGADCGGAASGYISVPQTRSLGVTTWLVPIASVIGPE